MKSYIPTSALSLLLLSSITIDTFMNVKAAASFVGISSSVVVVPSSFFKLYSSTARDGIALVDERTGKPTGTSFLPDEAIERAKVGNPIEKFKIAKDGSSAWVDIYDYAAKIRAGELDWEDVEKGDMDNVSFLNGYFLFFLLDDMI